MIFFDIDGTLIDHATASRRACQGFYKHFRSRIGLSREDFLSLWESILNKHFARFCRGEITVTEQRRARMRELFLDERLTDEQADGCYQVFARSYESQTRAFSDVQAALERVPGKRLGIISNGAREQQLRKLERAGLRNYFSILVFSEDIGLGKPAPRIFLEACRLAGVDPAGSFHVGDDPIADFAGSREAGMRAIWLNRYGLTGDSLPSATISSLRELAFALDGPCPVSRLAQA